MTKLLGMAKTIRETVKIEDISIDPNHPEHIMLVTSGPDSGHDATRPLYLDPKRLQEYGVLLGTRIVVETIEDHPKSMDAGRKLLALYFPENLSEPFYQFD